MTDKQIIIDGVDIGWCKNYNEANSKDCETLYICAENPNCYYKQLKRKEQECEELKGIRDGNFLHALEEQKRADKLSKTLTEIKEIAEICKCHNVDGCYECKYFDDCEVEDEEIPTRDVCKLILQKISECEANQ